MEIVMKENGEAPGSVWREEPSDQDDLAGRIVQLSSWMTILGTVRLICALGDYIGAFFELVRPGAPAVRMLGQFVQRYPPALILGMAWPLILALIVRRTVNRSYLRAAAATFLILGVGGIVTLLVEAYVRSDPELMVGPILVTRWGLAAGRPAMVVRALLGLVLLALELASASVAWKLSCRLPVEPARPQEGTRQRLRGRLAVYLTMAFLVLSVRHAAWSAYLGVLNQSTLVRQFVLQSDPGRRSGPAAALPNPFSQPQVRVNFGLQKAQNQALAARYDEASQSYLRVIHDLEVKRLEGIDDQLARVLLARALNNFAWMLATCEDPRFLRPEDSVRYAMQAVTLAPEEGTYWNTLGVAHYRVQEWDQADQALRRSMALRSEGQGDAYDWYFLAMLCARKGQRPEALSWYEKAVEWSRSMGGDPELYRFQVEAAERLGLGRPPRPAPRRLRGDGEPRVMPRNLHRQPPNLRPEAYLE